jgi:hypothetical protein
MFRFFCIIKLCYALHCRLCESSLLYIYVPHDIEATVGPGHGMYGGTKKRVELDCSLLTALLDRWRPEIHTFHLMCEEMTPTLQDISYLLGLPIVEETIGAIDVPDTWRVELYGRFAEVMLPPDRQPPLSRNCWIHTVLLNKY